LGLLASAARTPTVRPPARDVPSAFRGLDLETWDRTLEPRASGGPRSEARIAHRSGIGDPRLEVSSSERARADRTSLALESLGADGHARAPRRAGAFGGPSRAGVGWRNPGADSSRVSLRGGEAIPLRRGMSPIPGGRAGGVRGSSRTSPSSTSSWRTPARGADVERACEDDRGRLPQRCGALRNSVSRLAGLIAKSRELATMIADVDLNADVKVRDCGCRRSGLLSAFARLGTSLRGAPRARPKSASRSGAPVRSRGRPRSRRLGRSPARQRFEDGGASPSGVDLGGSRSPSRAARVFGEPPVLRCLREDGRTVFGAPSRLRGDAGLPGPGHCPSRAPARPEHASGDGLRLDPARPARPPGRPRTRPCRVGAEAVSRRSPEPRSMRPSLAEARPWPKVPDPSARAPNRVKLLARRSPAFYPNYATHERPGDP